jgi:thioesterase domain-containing protein
MARHYVDSILDVQGTGPYCLAGYSLGGLIAYEVAQQLLKRGHEIAVLTMLDAYLDDATFLMQTLRHAKGGLWNLRKKNPKCDEATLHSIFAMPARMRSVIVKLGEAMATYRPKPYPGSVLFFRASIVHPRWNDSTPIWESLCEQSFRIVEIVGTHKEMIESPNIKDIAFILDLCLASRTEKV